ncbi:hypothetical protein BC938DRAFT_471136 [Jimgerdemannia flammicorona]|uniref:Uncharacterized protein n=1 Tax=Jimgerdemannia flammicorona TaxID=994334 RepID=A0A433Q8S6_9FUNG|nr:hypothetical protein BC938DRAFT_471136 [Jimgerdemannia flammicorona]
MDPRLERGLFALSSNLLVELSRLGLVHSHGPESFSTTAYHVRSLPNPLCLLRSSQPPVPHVHPHPAILGIAKNNDCPRSVPPISCSRSINKVTP